MNSDNGLEKWTATMIMHVHVHYACTSTLRIEHVHYALLTCTVYAQLHIYTMSLCGSKTNEKLTKPFSSSGISVTVTMVTGSALLSSSGDIKPLVNFRIVVH